MKSIKKITNKVTNNVSTLAGSALLVGATLTGGAAFAAAQSSGSSGNSMDLGDYPQPFVTEDGQVDTSIVLGSDAKVTDVVGATEIAGSLGNAAFKQTSVSTEGGSFGWSATNGVTLDTRNDQLYFGDQLNTVRETLTQDNLQMLSETTFKDDNNDETDITNYLDVGGQSIQFSNSPDELDNKDPVVHVPLPTDVTTQNYLYNLQANFEDSIAFNASDVAGETIQLFGKEYTIADENAEASHDNEELLLYGSSQEVEVTTGKSTTVTINGEETTIEVVSVNDGSTDGDSGNAAVRIGGSLESVEKGDEISVNNEEVRIDEIIQTGGSESSKGVVNFKIGSQELTLKDGEPIQDSNGNDIDGTKVYFNGNTNPDNKIGSISSIDVYVGAPSDDKDALTAGETFTHPTFPGVEVHFGGLNPDASKESDAVSEVSFSTSGDENVQVSFTGDSGNEASITFANWRTGEDSNNQVDANELYLENGDKDTIHTVENASVAEDEYFTTDAGDFSHMWRVQNIDVDEQNPGTDGNNGDEATIDLKDVVTGDTVEVDINENPSEDSGVPSSDDKDPAAEYTGTEVIDGQTYTFNVETGDEGSSNDAETVSAEWDNGATSVFTPIDLQSGAALAFADTATVAANTTIELPSTQSTDAKMQYINTTDDSSTEDGEFTVGQIQYQWKETANAGSVNVSIDPKQGTDSNYQAVEPSAVVIEPEDESDSEQAYIQTVGATSDDNVDVSGFTYTGEQDGSNNADVPGFRQVDTLESNDDVTAGFDVYGAYTEYDSSDQGSAMIKLPDGQATAGAAITGADGSLSKGGGSGSVQAAQPTRQFAQGVLANDGNIGQVKNNENVILVGGPAANSLTQELVEMNQTMPASEYTQGQGIIQMVDGFSEGNKALVVAGYSGADTRRAAEFLANYRDHQQALEGQKKVKVETSSGTVVQ